MKSKSFFPCPSATRKPDHLLKQKEFIESYLKESSCELSVLSFVNIFAWQDFFKFDFQLIDRNLCIFAHNELGCFQYLPPLGKNVSLQTIEQCFSTMESINKGNGLTRIENISAKKLDLFSSDQYSLYKKSEEYVYFKDDIVHLKGNRYKSKRSSYNQFQREYTFQYCPYEKGMKDSCLALYEDWVQNRSHATADSVYLQMLQENRQVHELILEYHKELGLIGRVVMMDDRVEAYTFGYELNSKVFCVLFEITSLEMSGSAVYLFREFCRDPICQRYSFINAMDDFGMENIRRTKMSFYPRILLPCYVAKQKEQKRY